MNGAGARLFGTGESALAILCPHCRGPIEVHVLAGGAPSVDGARATPEMIVSRLGAILNERPTRKVRHCGCGHPDSFHADGIGKCEHGKGTAFGGCDCTHFHARRRRPAAAVATEGGAPRRPAREGAALRILRAIAQRGPEGATVKQIALLTGYSRRGGGSGSFRKTMAALLRDRQAEKTGDRFRLTTHGYDAIGGAPKMPHGSGTLDYWAELLGACAGSILQRVTVAHPAGVAVDEVRAVLGYSGKGGGSGSFRRALGELRELGLLTRDEGGRLRASDRLMQQISEH